MNFASLSTIILYCVFCSSYSIAFKLNAVNPNENEVNLANNYYIQNAQSGLVIGAVNSESPRPKPTTMVAIEGAATDPELQAKLLWNLNTQAGIPAVTNFLTVGPNAQNNLQEYEQCLTIGCAWLSKDWVLRTRGNSTWEIRHKYYLGGPSDYCLTSYGLHEELTWEGQEALCDSNNDSQKWRLVRVQ